MSTAHTPGPWFVDKLQDRNAYNIFPHGATHALLTVSGPVHDGAHRYAQEAEANAHLIASAPELLAALQASEKALSEALTLLMNSGLVVVDTGEGELMDVEGAVGRIDTAIDSAREVVAKATGEQQ